MEFQNHLGIYLSKDTATVVCLGSQGRGRRVLGCFSVSLEQTEEPNPQALANLISRGCDERGLEFSEVAVALDCAMFMQHSVHSKFNDPKQIAATVRFDTEEALATDIAEVAIAFKAISSGGDGSALTIFTAQRKVLSDVLLSLQSNNLDPVTIEPDVNCLSRFIGQNMSSQYQPAETLFVMLSRNSGYFIIFSKSQDRSYMRTFLIGPRQDRAELIARELPVTAALVGNGEPISRLEVFDSSGSVDFSQLSGKLGIELDSVDLAGMASTDSETLADCTDLVGFAIAYGAALAHLEKTRAVNFRNDFSPYQGGKIRMQKAIKLLSIFVTVFVLAVGLYFQVQLLQRNKYRSQLRDKFGKQYSAVMFAKKLPVVSSPVKKLMGELRRIRDVKSGQLSITGEESVSAKLTLLLAAFNKCAAQTNLEIDSIAIAAKITLVGSTSSRKNTLALFKAIKNGQLDILQQRLYSKANRDNFSITVVPKKR